MDLENSTTPFVVTGQIDKITSSGVVYNWEIQNFDRICPKNANTFQTQVSETFIAGESVGKKSLWYGNCVYEEQGLYLYLKQNRLDSSWASRLPISTRFEVALLSASGADIIRRRENNYDFTLNTGRGGVMLVPKVAVLWENEATHLEGNTLRLQIVLEIFGRKIEKLEPVLPLRDRIQDQGVANLANTIQKLQADLKALYNNEATSDTTVHCGRTTFFVHRAIIAARSQVFAAKFHHDTKEAQNNRIDINDFEPPVVDAGLRYIYNGDLKAVSVSDDMIQNVIPFADKYGLAELKTFCFQNLITKMNAERFGSFAVLVHLHGTDEPDLKRYVRNYIITKMPSLMENEYCLEYIVKHPQVFFGKAGGHKSATGPSKAVKDPGDGDKTESTSILKKRPSFFLRFYRAGVPSSKPGRF